jgi:hypothetical protein
MSTEEVILLSISHELEIFSRVGCLVFIWNNIELGSLLEILIKSCICYSCCAVIWPGNEDENHGRGFSHLLLDGSSRAMERKARKARDLLDIDGRVKRECWIGGDCIIL